MAKKKRVNVVYSTNPDFDYLELSDEVETLPFNKQKLYILLERKNRGGKSVTLVEGFIGKDDDAKDLAKKLKQHCGVGGGFKNTEIYIQGDHKSKIASFLKKLGAEVKLKGG